MTRTTPFLVVLLFCLTVLAQKAAEIEAAASDSEPAVRPWEDRPAMSVPAAELLAATTNIEADDDDDVHFFLRDREYLIDDEGRLTVRTHEVFRLQTRQGLRSNSVVEAFWQPWLEDRPTIQARVVTKSGKEFQLDQKNSGGGARR